MTIEQLETTRAAVLENTFSEYGRERGVQRAVSLMDLYGSCEGEDTLDAYFERKRMDKTLEEKRFTPHSRETGA
jgi:hypothetical protein